MAKRAQQKTSKPRKKPRTKASAPGAAAVVQAVVDRNADDVQEAFIVHRSSWTQWQAKLKAVEKIGIDVKAALKADGFTVKQMQIADDLSGSAKSEQKIATEVKDRLQVARWIGHALGAQFDLFSEPDRTPSVDQAFDAGKRASMENKQARPPHSPETEQYRSWMAGYQEHQDKLMKGFKAPPDDDDDGDDRVAALADDAIAGDERDAAAEPGDDGPAPAPLPRKEFAESLAETTAAGEAFARKH